MFRRLLKRIKRNGSASLRDYEKSLARYRRRHPESLEEERQQILQWLAYATARRQEDQPDSRDNRLYAEQATLARALYELKETARAAFMRHPAATEDDFRRCWPGIREEMLKKHALEELAADPMLSLTFATQASETNGTFVTTQEPHSPNLQLLKRSTESD